MAFAVPVEKREELVKNAARIVAPGKGILAADERCVAAIPKSRNGSLGSW